MIFPTSPRSAHLIARRLAVLLSSCTAPPSCVCGLLLGDCRQTVEPTKQTMASSLNFEQERITSGGWQTSTNPMGTVDLSAREMADFSIINAVNASLSNDWSKAGLERAASRDIARRLGREPATGGFFVPVNLNQRAAYAVGATGTGGALVATNLLPERFIDALVNKMAIMNAGATVLPGLIGNVDLPKKSTTATGYWVAESGAITESEATFAKVQLRPRVVGAYSKWSRLTLQQSTPDIEMIARGDLAGVLGRAVDLAALAGTGASNQPTGILATSGVGSVAIGTNGGAISLETMIDLRTAIAAANVDASTGSYIVNEKTYGALLKLKTSGSGEYLFAPEGIEPGPGNLSAMKIAGCPVIVSNQLTSSGTKGTGTGLSTAVFGAFQNLVIGNWGVLELLVNPYGSGYTAGDVEIRAMQTIDVAVRYPESFSKCVDIAA